MNTILGRRRDGRPIFPIAGGAPTPLEVMQTRLSELRSTVDDLTAKRGKLIDAAAAAKRGFTADEQKNYDELGVRRDQAEKDLEPVQARVDELAEAERREQLAATHRAEIGETGEQRGNAKVTEKLVYQRGDASVSMFRDLYLSRKGNREALERLIRHQAQVVEKRALSTAAGAGGEFAPPLWLIDQYVPLARAGRKFADSLHPMNLPSGVDSVNIPKVTGGTSTAVQSSQNSSVSQTDLTTGSVSSAIVTIAGKQVVALQLIEQSGMPFDEVIAADLAASHAQTLDTQSISGSGADGQLEGVYTYFAASGTVNTTYTQSSPAVGGTGGLYAKIFAAAAAIETARFLPPDTVWMHPRRWAAILAASDSQNRPLVVPAAVAQNPVATTDGLGGAEGPVGSIGGLKVITDANIPTNTGSGTNQDPVLVGIEGDLKLWESSLNADSFDAPYADSMGILFRVYSYAAQIPSRYTTSVSVINGTGLVTPTF